MSDTRANSTVDVPASPNQGDPEPVPDNRAIRDAVTPYVAGANTTRRRAATPLSTAKAKALCQTLRQRLTAIPEVQTAYSLAERRDLDFWVVLERESREAQKQVFQALADLYRVCGDVRLDFLVVSRERVGDAGLKTIIPAEAEPFYQRA